MADEKLRKIKMYVNDDGQIGYINFVEVADEGKLYIDDFLASLQDHFNVSTDTNYEANGTYRASPCAVLNVKC